MAQHTYLSIVLISPSHFRLSCEPSFFDYLMCTAAVVTPESYQTLAYLSAQYEWSEPLCVGISTVCTVSVLHITLRLPQFFCPHSSVCISESCSCTCLVSAYIVALFQCFRMVPVSCSSGGEQKCARKNCTPLARGTIEPSVNNGFSTHSSKKLQLETLDLDSKLIGL